jgi:tRNA splicing endonuclease
VYSYLHTTLNLHVGDGSKFGCDYLVYDGDREVRHAFAGVRVVPEGGSIEIGDVTGWVRAMNKAGKISVLCYVENERGRRGRRRMGFVDSVLEKREIVKWKGKKKSKVRGAENVKKV